MSRLTPAHFRSRARNFRPKASGNLVYRPVIIPYPEVCPGTIMDCYLTVCVSVLVSAHESSDAQGVTTRGGYPMTAAALATVQVPTSLLESLKQTLSLFATQAEAAESVIKAADAGDANKLLVSLRPQHERYAEVTQLQAQLDDILAAIDKDNEGKVQLPTEDEVTKAREVLASLREQSKSMLPVLKTYAGDDYLDEVPDILRPKKGRPAGGTVQSGTGKRPRLEKMVISDLKDPERVLFTGNSDNDDPSVKPTFTNAARIISKDAGEIVKVEFLQNHAFEVAGTNDLSLHNGDITFAVTVKDKHYNFVITPRKSE